VQTGLGPFLAAYLASSGWNQGSVGYVLTFGGLVGVAMQTPAGAVIHNVRSRNQTNNAMLPLAFASAQGFSHSVNANRDGGMGFTVWMTVWIETN
jgi:hypothetical protein